MRLPSEAVAVVEPSLQRPHHPEDRLGPLRVVRVRALWSLGRLVEAQESAREALSVESSERTRQGIREALRDVLSD